MGMLDKATKLAAAARAQLETAREQLDDVHPRRVPAAPLATAPRGAREEQLVRDAIAAGAPDPATLLSCAQASAALGHELGGPNLTCGERSIGVAYEASAPGDRHWRVEVSCWRGAAAVFDAAACFRETIAARVAGAAVAELGDRALWDGVRLYVLTGDRLFDVATHAPEGTSVAQASAVARRVLANLPG